MPSPLHSPLNAKLGIVAEDRADGSVHLSLETDASFASEGGLVHGGIVALLLDGAMGRAVERSLGPAERCATVQISVQYLAPAEGVLSATGRIVRRGRTVAFVEAECTRADGRTVARAHGTWVVR